MLRALSRSGTVVIHQTSDLSIDWSHNVPESWRRGRWPAMSDTDLYADELAARMVAAKRRVLATGSSETLEFEHGDATSPRWHEAHIDADGSDIITTILDVTDRRKREQALRLLLREVSHRSKNLLAVILSIANQTERHASSLENFLARFRGRVYSLASSQDIVTSSDWRGATLRELVDSQAELCREGAAGSIRFEGANLSLMPNAAMHVGLALHELVANSIAHGALARTDGEVRVVCRVSSAEAGEAPGAIVEWYERAHAPAPHERRFGSVALERVVPASLGGQAKLSFGQEWLLYRLTMPPENFEIAPV